MTDHRRYRVHGDVLAAHLEGEAVLLNMETKDYFRLNETAAAVFRGVERGLDRQALLDELCSGFDVDPPSAGRELDALLDDLARRGIVVLDDPEGGTP
jgi:hypothetical protein